MDADAQAVEIVGSHRLFEQHVGHPAGTIVSRAGPPCGEDPATDRLIKMAGDEVVFSNDRIQRL